MTDVLLRDEIDDGIVRLTLNRPDRLNALTIELVELLHEALGDLERDRSARVVIVTGAGRGFCAGMDLGGTGDLPDGDRLGTAAAGMGVQQLFAGLVPRMRRLRQPVVAAVNGPATGGGFSLALGADIRIAAMSARLNAAYVRVGFSGTDMGSGWLLPRLVGASRAFELLLTGRLIDAAEAERIGLVLSAVPDDDLMETVLTTARLIRGNSPFGVWMTKEVMWSNLEVSMQAGMDLENRNQILASMTDDRHEATAAFVERRSPVFRYR